MVVVMSGKMPTLHEQELAMRLEQEREFEAWKRHLIRQREQNSKSESSSLTTAAVVTYAISSGGGSDSSGDAE